MVISADDDDEFGADREHGLGEKWKSRQCPTEEDVSLAIG
jgi:hypothetical protein